MVASHFLRRVRSAAFASTKKPVGSGLRRMNCGLPQIFARTLAFSALAGASPEKSGPGKVVKVAEPLGEAGSIIGSGSAGEMSAMGQKRTLFTVPFYVGFTPESGHLSAAGRIYEYTPLAGVFPVLMGPEHDDASLLDPAAACVPLLRFITENSPLDKRPVRPSSLSQAILRAGALGNETKIYVVAANDRGCGLARGSPVGADCE